MELSKFKVNRTKLIKLNRTDLSEQENRRKQSNLRLQTSEKHLKNTVPLQTKTRQRRETKEEER